MTLSTTISAGTSTMEIFVDYDAKHNAVIRIRKVFIQDRGQMVNASDLMVTHFEPCLNKIIEQTDWKEIYQQQYEPSL